MANSVFFTTDEEIRREVERVLNSDFQTSDDEYFPHSSDDDDNILPNDDDQEDEFDVHPDDNLIIQDQSPHEISNMETEDGEDCRNFLLGKDGETIWTDANLLPSKHIRVPQRNIITHLPGPKGDARNVVDQVRLWSLFINFEMISIIVQHTNEEIERKKAGYGSDQRYIGPTDAIEVNALLGLLYFAGVLRGSNLNVNDLFSRVYGPPLFRATMSKNRFLFLLRCMRFDDKATREERRITDKFAPFRDFWSMFNQNCSVYYTPSEYLTVDETLLSFRGRCPFKMYMPSKPDKYGLKIVSICDARTFFFCGGIPYIGRDTIRSEGLLLPTQYVLQLTEPFRQTNRNITCDNWFSSIELCEELCKHKLTMVGTLRKNKREIPPSFIAVKGVPLGTSRFLYQPDKTMVSYHQKKNKNVILLSSMHDTGTVNPESQKPDIVEMYNLTKGGVDVFDKLSHSYSTKRCSNRWPMRYFFGVLDAAAINSFVLYCLNNHTARGSSRSDFLKQLAYSLVEPFMKARAMNPRLPMILRNEIKTVLGLPEEQSAPSRPARGQPGTRKRCHLCTNDSKTYNSCDVCKKPTCGLHEKVRRVCVRCEPEVDKNEEQ